MTRIWVLGQMGAARLSFRAIPEVQFWKLCGSGTGEGFTPIPNTQVWAILAVWEDESTAEGMVANADVYCRWRDRADENWTIFLGPTSARGAWSGKAPFDPVWATPEAGSGLPMAALTRATIKPGALPRFWGREPDVSRAIGNDPNVLFKIGIGEVPWLHQVTFSVWPDTEAMANFARKDGPHARAIRAVREGGWFKEELYARFRVLGTTGAWESGGALGQFERQAA